MAALTYSNSAYIIRGTLSIAENALGSQDLVSVSIGNDTRITVDPDLVGYAADNNARWWKVTGKNYQLQKSEKYHVYVKCQRQTQDAALFLSTYAYDLRGYRLDADGNRIEDVTTHDGVSVDNNPGDPANWYIRIGEISEPVSNRRKATVDMGKYGTGAAQEDNLASIVEKLTFGLIDKIKEWVSKFFLSRDKDDTAEGRLTLNKGFEANADSSVDGVLEITGDLKAYANAQLAGNLSVGASATIAGSTTVKDVKSNGFVTGAEAGRGFSFDNAGNGELQNLRVWQSLTVSELRFDRASVLLGTNIQTYTGGVVGKVEITGFRTGIIELQQEDDNFIGSVQDGALCVGYFHNMNGDNATADSDDFRGTIRYKGTTCCQFAIDGIENGNSTRFRYELREGTTVHPVVGMTFKGTGNMKDDSLGYFTIATPKYTAKYAFVNQWEWDAASHCIEVGGSDISGFASIVGETWQSPKAGTICTDIYTRGTIHQQGVNDRFLYITQSSNGMLMMGEAERVTIAVRDNYFRERTSEFTFVVEGAGKRYTLQTDPDGHKYFDVHFDDLNNEQVTFSITATDGTFNLSQPFTERKLIIDYHLEVIKASLDASHISDTELTFNDGSGLEFNDSSPIDAVIIGDTVSACRMLGTAITELGTLSYQVDDYGIVDIDNNDTVVVSGASSKITFTWCYDNNHEHILSQREIPVIINQNSYIIYHDGENTPEVPPAGQPFSDYGWYEGIRTTTVWMTVKVSSNSLRGEWGVPRKIVGTDGTSVSIKGRLPNFTAISLLGPDEVEDGNGYIAEDTGDMWVASKVGDTLTWINVGKIKGEPGLTAYLHIKYSNDGGLNFTPDTGYGIGETPGAYIGIVSNFEHQDPESTSAYRWKKIEGEKGDQGDKGDKGDNGKTTYTWFKYADAKPNAAGIFPPGTRNMYDEPDENTKYIGIAYNRLVPVAGDDASVYVWSNYKGPKGDQGEKGDQGDNGKSPKSVYLVSNIKPVMPDSIMTNVDVPTDWELSPKDLRNDGVAVLMSAPYSMSEDEQFAWSQNGQVWTSQNTAVNSQSHICIIFKAMMQTAVTVNINTIEAGTSSVVLDATTPEYKYEAGSAIATFDVAPGMHYLLVSYRAGSTAGGRLVAQIVNDKRVWVMHQQFKDDGTFISWTIPTIYREAAPYSDNRSAIEGTNVRDRGVWSPNATYENNTEQPTAVEKFVDAVTYNGHTYTLTTAETPHTGGDTPESDPLHWQLANEFGTIRAQYILAAGANIKFLTGSNFVVNDDNGQVVAGMGNRVERYFKLTDDFYDEEGWGYISQESDLFNEALAHNAVDTESYIDFPYYIWSGGRDRHHARTRIDADGAFYSERGEFRGLVRSNPTIITAENIGQYADITAGTDLSGAQYRRVDMRLDQIGSLMVFNNISDNPLSGIDVCNINLPFVCDYPKPFVEYESDPQNYNKALMNARSYIGCHVTVINNDSLTINGNGGHRVLQIFGVRGASGQSNPGNGQEPFILGFGNAITLECVMQRGCNNSDEEITWVPSSAGVIQMRAFRTF